MAKYPPKYPAKKPNDGKPNGKGNSNSPKAEKPEPIGKIVTVTIRDVKFKIVTADRGLPTKARMEFSMNYDDGKLNTVKMKLDVLACWIDLNTNNAIEAYAVFGGPGDTAEDAKLLRRIITAVPIIRVITSPGFVVTGGLGDCLRYSTKPDAGEYESGNELYETIQFFPSKYSAIMKVLAILERYGAIAGFQSADLNLVDDSLLESVGFFKVKDAVGNGSAVAAPPYWGVNTSEMFAVGATGGQYVDHRERDRQVTRMAVLFADKLRRTIESIGKDADGESAIESIGKEVS